MSSNIRDQLRMPDPKDKLNPLLFKYSTGPPPYTDVNNRTSTLTPKADKSKKYDHAPWLLRRTSIHVESAPAEFLDDQASEVMSISTTRSDEKAAKRPFLNRIASRHPEELHDDKSSIAPSSHAADSSIHEPSVYGTTVSIEAGKPKLTHTAHIKLRVLRSLEQAASMRYWAGAGQPAEVWGKLLKDPELWDSMGDTLVYFGYQRPQASFRIQSSMLKATHSDFLIGKLQDGLKRPSAVPSAHTPSATLPRIQNLSLGNRMRQGASPYWENNSVSQIRYEIHFPPPDEYIKVDILRHHITTRNFFALLLHKPLVGLTLFQALVDLHSRLQIYLPKDVDCAEVIMQYMIQTNSHNVCNDPAAAASLLAWSEDPGVQWLAGWREGFVHCCGMYTQVRGSPEFHDISHKSRILLERSYLELGARMQEAERTLSTFNFDEMWTGSEVQLHPSRPIFDQFRQFLQHFYTKATKKWPPRKAQESDDSWLTRKLVWVLQKDFGALYDYHVNRGVVWSQDKDPGIPHRLIVCQSDGQDVEVNSMDIPLAKIFTSFDRKHKCPHVPHPYPLLPASALDGEGKKQSRPRFFRSKSRELEKRTLLAFAEASNATLLGPDVTTNGLLEAFLKFEKTDDLGDLDPQDARKARWILLYGVLQILATLSVDVPDVCFEGDVSYFLNPRLKGTPPWRTEDTVFEEASRYMSYCWTTVDSWKAR